MKKLLALSLVLICTLGLVGCSTNDRIELETKVNDTLTNTEKDITTSEDNNTTDISENNSSTRIDEDSDIRAELISQYGLPFRLWRTEGMALWKFTISENTAKREYHHSMEGSFEQTSLSWKIANGELVITGEWEETFTLNVKEGQAISKKDGAIYRIIKQD